MKKIIAILLSMLIGFSACEPVETDNANGEDTEVTPGGSGNGNENEGGGNDNEGTGGEGTGEGNDGTGSGNEGGETPEVTESYYVEVAEDYSDWSGAYLITYTNGGTVLVLNSYSDTKGYSHDISSTMTAQGIHSSDGDQYKAVVEKSGSAYTINVAGIGYLGLESGKNSVNASSSPQSSDNYKWTLSYKDGGSVWVKNVAHSNYRLQWNASANIFRCYNGSQEELTLYRRGTSTGTVTPPSGGDDNTGGDNTGGNTGGDDNTGGDNTGSGGNTGGGDDDEEIPTPVPGQSGKYGWYELPAISYSQSGNYLIDTKDSDLYYAHHLCAGNETGPGGKKARNYTVCFSAEHHCPVWVAAPRHEMYNGGAKRTDAYTQDPSIPSSIQYKKKDADSGCNNGHMLGSAERTSSTATNKQVFYFSNIAPQRMNTFNTGGGGWNNLEDWVDGQVCSDTLYVVIGAYFDKYTDRRGYSDSPAKISFGGRSDVSRPTMFYYILMRTKSGSSGKPLSKCSASEIKCAAFVRSHNTPTGVKVSSQDLMSVSDLEKITGFSYFPNVPQAPKDSYNAKDWGL